VCELGLADGFAEGADVVGVCPCEGLVTPDRPVAGVLLLPGFLPAVLPLCPVFAGLEPPVPLALGEAGLSSASGICV